MKIKYVAFDGTEFEDEASCKSYEKKIELTCIMWDRNGAPTDDTASAYLIYLDEYGYSRFLALAKKISDPIRFMDIIDDKTSGFFIYDEWECAYRYLDEDVIGCILRVVGQPSDALENQKNREIRRKNCQK